VVNIFARELTDDLASLVKQIDNKISENQDKKMTGFLVLLTDDPDAAEAKLEKFAKDNGIKNIPLTTFDGVSGPPKYKVAQGADVTVMMWLKRNVKVNHAFAKGKLNSKSIKAVVADTSKILN